MASSWKIYDALRPMAVAPRIIIYAPKDRFPIKV